MMSENNQFQLPPLRDHFKDILADDLLDAKAPKNGYYGSGAPLDRHRIGPSAGASPIGLPPLSGATRSIPAYHYQSSSAGYGSPPHGTASPGYSTPMYNSSSSSSSSSGSSGSYYAQPGHLGQAPHSSGNPLLGQYGTTHHTQMLPGMYAGAAQSPQMGNVAHDMMDYENYAQVGASPNSRKRRANLPKATTDILLNWLMKNLDRPYPNSQEKSDLVQKTGLTFQQLDNWFINARRRKVKSLKESRERSI